LWTCWPCQAYLPAMSFAVWSEWRIPGSSATKKDGGFLGSGDQAVKHQKLKIDICICLFTPKKDPSLSTFQWFIYLGFHGGFLLHLQRDRNQSYVWAAEYVEYLYGQAWATSEPGQHRQARSSCGNGRLLGCWLVDLLGLGNDIDIPKNFGRAGRAIARTLEMVQVLVDNYFRRWHFF